MDPPLAQAGPAHYFLPNLRGADFARYRDQRRLRDAPLTPFASSSPLVGHLFEIARKEWGMEGLMNR